MLLLQGVTYTHPDRTLLFSGIDLVIHRYDKAAVIGNNGAGKSTLLQLMAGRLLPAAGVIKADATPYYIPQLAEWYNNQTVAEALQVHQKLHALQQILEGDVSEVHLTQLNDDWTVEERCKEALSYWGLDHVVLNQPMAALSGGQRTKVLLAGILIHEPEIVLLDEPTNHLDAHSRQLLYNYIQEARQTIVVVSHDKALLNMLPVIYELSRKGITVYGGNYDFYAAQKELEKNALQWEVKSAEKALRKAKEVEREAIERQQKLDARGKRKQEKEGLPTIAMNTFRNNAEKSTARMKDVHEEKTGALAENLQQLRKELPVADTMKLAFAYSGVHRGKLLVTAREVNMQFGGRYLWKQPLHIEIRSGERIAVKGQNGSGKTTLLRLLLGQLTPTSGTIERTEMKTVYIDQDYSLIQPGLTVYAQAQTYNDSGLQEHEIKSRLSRFLFTKEDWDKPGSALSGGERMRLLLCIMTISSRPPDIIILDEPTNNLDIQNIDILTAAMEAYEGTLIVVSHDAWFTKQINAGISLVLQ
ncbi:ATPase subunit of ABC transporter with duplicated ATPase domains [Filimonas zeae]|uniref:ABC transporter ATP-binding protein n=1 Tax=Filimonas zeae TaxID=1737353 RepID=A0A917IZC8_9BACT|nr:ABC-F family ATP-binding cassette domain-containing protein [Filimonas zeae]MDR6340056.1 ATPase subunit of ABC transporter with duplicated ATPase domains [Filimonas zeae]GGH70926.1 ABC transporter ATP-binding protein [Filimonas zeae]